MRFGFRTLLSTPPSYGTIEAYSYQVEENVYEDPPRRRRYLRGLGASSHTLRRSYAMVNRIPPMDPEDIRKVIFEWYPTDYWRAKTKALYICCADPSLGVSASVRAPGPVTDVEQSFLYWKTEIQMTAYHCTEALFAFLYSVWSRGPYAAWTLLINYQTDQLDDWVEEIQEDGEEAFDEGGTMPSLPETFFPGIDEDDLEGTLVADFLEYVERYLPRLAEFYSDRQQYNQYKHGLALFPSKSNFELETQPEDGEGETLTSPLDDHLFFYDTYPQEPPQPPKYALERRSIDPDRALRIIEVNSLFLENLQNVYSGFLSGADSVNIKAVQEPSVPEVFMETLQGDFKIQNFTLKLDIDTDPRTTDEDPRGLTEPEYDASGFSALLE